MVDMERQRIFLACYARKMKPLLRIVMMMCNASSDSEFYNLMRLCLDLVIRLLAGSLLSKAARFRNGIWGHCSGMQKTIVPVGLLQAA
jgi:hypothetical protein